jgi:hypothetical protein
MLMATGGSTILFGLEALPITTAKANLNQMKETEAHLNHCLVRILWALQPDSIRNLALRYMLQNNIS